MTQFHARFARVECEVVFGFQGPGVAEERRAMAAGDVERPSVVDTAAREWMGLVAYWITGMNSEFFPGHER